MQTFPPKPAPPIFKGMTPAENETWLNAHNWAYTSIVAALERVEKSPSPGASDYAAWFDANKESLAHWWERRQTVIQALSKMCTRMSTIPVVYKKSADAVNCKRQDFWDKLVHQREAFAEIGTKDQEIGLCPKAFDDDYLRLFYWDAADWARAFIVVHETYHTSVDTKESAAVADSYYDRMGCSELPSKNPGLAVKNAQNYAYFVMGSFWIRPHPAPGWLPDYGIWTEQSVGGAWGSAAESPAATAMTHTQNLVLVAYREPDAQGGRLWCRILRVNDGGDVWLDPMLFRILGDDGTAGECRSLVAPALAAWGREFYCAYIGQDKKLLFARADTTKPYSTEMSLDLIWIKREEIDGYPLLSQSPMPNPSPALAAYRPDPKGRLNQSAGLYCVYVNSTSELRCSVRLDGGPGKWIPVPFDKRRETVVTPALLVFEDRLKCVYVDGATGKFVMLTYDPVMSAPAFRDSKAGTWYEDGHWTFPLEAETIALGQWTTSRGAIMVAAGNKSAKDGSLHYSLFSEIKSWSDDVRMTTLTSPNCPALVGCGSSLYLFYRSVDGTIHSRVAREHK